MLRLERLAPGTPRPPINGWMLAGIGLIVAYSAFLLAGFMAGAWLIDASGRPVATDFINVWAAGRLSLQGQAASAYDWVAHKAVEAQATGYDFDGYFGWHYPPPFLLIAAPLALLPYTIAHIVWMGISAPLYVAAMRAASAGAIGVIAALAFPAVLWTVADGQNAFLTAALLGGGLTLLPRRPIVAGLLFGLLTYKPQFGMLIPLGLLAGRQWRAIGSACVTALALDLVSGAVLGFDTWDAFLHSASQTNQAIMVDGLADFAKLQSVFAIARTMGAGVAVAWTLHGIFVAALAIWVVRIWRSDVAACTKAAILALATVAASPYVYLYDLVTLVVPIAFMARAGLSSPERWGVALAGLLILAGPMTPLPTGFAALLVVAAMAARRAGAEHHPSPIREAWPPQPLVRSI